MGEGEKGRRGEGEKGIAVNLRSLKLEYITG
jgi:hypothetical protein